MRPPGHIIVTFGISALVYLAFKSASSFFISLAAGILIDLDHVLDYYLQQGVTLKINKIYDWCLKREFQFFFVFFHSLELIFLLWAAIWGFKLSLFWAAFAIGLTQHMVFDILFNEVHGYSYFLSYRISKGFQRSYLCKF